MANQTLFVLLLAVWLGCLALVLWGQRKDGSGTGLVISYALQLWLLHWLAAAIYALPWYGPATPFSLWGLQQSTVAIAGFALGSAIAAPFLLRHRVVAMEPGAAGVADPWLVRTFLVVGAVSFFVLEPLLHPIPTAGALASATSNLLLVGLGMECWNGLQERGRHRRSFWRWVVLTAALPFVTIVTKGFLGYGFAAMITVFAFVASAYRPRWKLVVCSTVIGYFALSLYVTYMRDRQDIRRVVWGQEAYSSRFSTVAKTLGSFEIFDIGNLDHLARIDERLNQNFLVGMAVRYLEIHPDRVANGRTIWEALLSPIPRTLWPDKPIVAGSGDLVSEFTGLRFGENTSIGIGHVMEWYVNFGTYGVFFGMIFMGISVGWFDRMAAERLNRGNWAGFALWWVPGLSLLQVGGSLVEAVSGACAGWVVFLLINWFRPTNVHRRSDAPTRVPSRGIPAAYKARHAD